MANSWDYESEIDHVEVAKQVKMCDHVLAGPWVGEFGWELFCYQGYLRKLREDNPHLKSFNVISKTGRGVLYDDFCDIYIEWDCPGRSCTGALCMDWNGVFSLVPGGDPIQIQDVMARFKLDKCLWIPTQKFIINYHASGPRYEEYMQIFRERQHFIQYGKKSDAAAYDVVFHARSTDKFNTGHQNWPTEKYDELRSTLVNLRTASIGLSDQAYHVPNTDNLLDIPLDETANVLASSKCIVGSSSGPMHFASLCGCPQILISECVESGGKDNERRYKEDWNPLNTPVTLIKYEDSKKDNGWNPPVQSVAIELFKLLEKIDT